MLMSHGSHIILGLGTCGIHFHILAMLSPLTTDGWTGLPQDRFVI
jgi:hypothetical protein